MARLVLVRHGETVWQREHRYSGSSDVALSDRGRRQAELLGRWAKEADIDALWSSPLRRARHTAEAVTRATGLEATVDERLRELHFGEGEGRTLDELARAFPDEVAAFRSDPVGHHLPEGEDPRAAVRRAAGCLGEIATVHPGGRVMVVFHSTLLRLVLCELLGVPLNDYRRVFPMVRNCALTEIVLEAGLVSLMEFNTPIDFAAGDR